MRDKPSGIYDRCDRIVTLAIRHNSDAVLSHNKISREWANGLSSDRA